MIQSKQVKMQLYKPFIIKSSRVENNELEVFSVTLREPILYSHKLMSRCDSLFKKALLEAAKQNKNEKNENEQQKGENESGVFSKYINNLEIKTDDKDIEDIVSMISMTLPYLTEMEFNELDECLKSLFTVKTNMANRATDKCVMLLNDDISLELNDFEKLSYIDYQRIRAVYFMVFFMSAK